MLYVDKTEALFNLVSRSTINFLARPRRFGKSLLCSTLEYFYKGRRDLFKDLWIDKNTERLGLKWAEYPVIHLDMSGYKTLTKADFINDLKSDLQETAKSYELELEFHTETALFHNLIEKLVEKYKKRVVILIDEYDAPIVRNLGRELEIKSNLIEEFRVILQNFYSVLKASDRYIHFLFLTGVSKFSKMGIFSGLNNLYDLSQDAKYASLLGYTQAELETNFADYLNHLANQFDAPTPAILGAIREWYNGYRFTRADISVYNPFSTLALFQRYEFENYWFESGGTSSLMNLLVKKQYAVKNLNLIERRSDIFQGFDIERIEVENLLYFSGYLTIKDVKRLSFTESVYTLAYPNLEVQRSFIRRFLVRITDGQYHDDLSKKLYQNLIAEDSEALKKNLQNFIRNVPYVLHQDKEVFYQSMLYALFILTGFDVAVEEYTNIGRIDILCKLPNQIYIFELKLNQTAGAALAQIKHKEYYAKYLSLYPNRQVHIVGLNIDTAINNINELKVERLK